MTSAGMKANMIYYLLALFLGLAQTTDPIIFISQINMVRFFE